MTEVNKRDIQRLYKDRTGYSGFAVKLVKTVMDVFFGYVVSCKRISLNPKAVSILIGHAGYVRQLYMLGTNVCFV